MRTAPIIGILIAAPFAANAPAHGEAKTLAELLGVVSAQAGIGTWQTTVIAAAPTSNITTGSTNAADIGHRPRGTPEQRLNGDVHALYGEASFYHEDQLTASGERFDKTALTAAHKTLPFGTRVRVTRADTGKNVIVRINDRGPYKGGRIIDLSEAAAKHIGMTAIGIAPVKLEVLGR